MEQALTSVQISNNENKKTIDLDGHARTIKLFNGQNRYNIILDAKEAKIELGDNFQEGKLLIKDASGEDAIVLDGSDGKIRVQGKTLRTADDVFDSDYPLLSLLDTQAFIKKNNHLPEIPSATVMKEQGLDLIDLTMTLLRKVEELTLHIIAQKEEIENLKARG